jgi:WD40 repeat protein
MIKNPLCFMTPLLLTLLVGGAPSADGQQGDAASRLAAIQPVVPASAGDGQRGDLYGDPLPRGALARLGTIRYRHPGWYKRIAALDNQTFAVGTSDNTVRLWDAATGKTLREIGLRDARLQAFALSHPRKHLAVLASLYDQAKREYTMLLKVWQLPAWTEQAAQSWIEPLSENSQQLAVAPDGSLVATGTYNGKLRLWDTASGQEILSYPVMEGQIESIDFSPSGELLAVGGRQGAVLWNWLSENKPLRLPQLARYAQVVLFSPDGTQLAVGANDGIAAQLYEVPSGKLIRPLRVLFRPRPTRCAGQQRQQGRVF